LIQGKSWYLRLVSETDPIANHNCHTVPDRFGGKICGDKASVPLEDGASRFIIERFLPHRTMQTLHEFATDQQGTTGIFILDVNGHFVTAMPMESDDGPLLLVVNTTAGNYIDGCEAALAFDLVFPANSN